MRKHLPDPFPGPGREHARIFLAHSVVASFVKTRDQQDRGRYLAEAFGVPSPDKLVFWSVDHSLAPTAPPGDWLALLAYFALVGSSCLCHRYDTCREFLVNFSALCLFLETSLVRTDSAANSFPPPRHLRRRPTTRGPKTLRVHTSPASPCGHQPLPLQALPPTASLSSGLLHRRGTTVGLRPLHLYFLYYCHRRKHSLLLFTLRTNPTA